MKNKYIFVLCLIFGLLTSYLIFSYLTGVEQALSNVEYGEVVVAAVNIPAKTLVSYEMLDLKKVPVKYIHPQAIRSKDEVIGNVTLTSLVQGEGILRSKIAKSNEAKNGLAYLVPSGKRAVTVPVDEVSGIAGLIKPGDRLDVAATISIPEGEREVPFSVIVLQDIKVLAVGKNMEEKDTPETKTVTLAVTVEESRSLILASQKGNIRLMMRSHSDNSTVNTVPFKAEYFKQ